MVKILAIDKLKYLSNNEYRLSIFYKNKIHFWANENLKKSNKLSNPFQPSLKLKI